MLWLTAWRNLMRRKTRTLLTLLSIIIGVSSTFAVIAAVDSAEKAFPLYLKEAFGKSDFNVLGTDAYFSEDLFAEVQSFKNTASVAVLKENTKLYWEDERISAIQKRVALTGYSDLDTPVTNFKVVKGDLSSGGAVITDQEARIMQLDIGQTLSFETDQGIRTLPISAIVKYTVELMGPSSWGMAKYHHWSVAVPLPVVQEWFGREGKIQGIQVKALQPSELKPLEQQVDALTKRHDGIYMQPVTLDFNSDLTDSFFIALYVAGFLGIALSAFVIFNSLYVSVTERKKEFAALKTIGFTPGQLQKLVLFEVLLISLIGTALGLTIGYGFAVLLKMIVFLMFGITDQSMMEPWNGFRVALLAGMTVPVLASLFPIRQAGKVSVIAVLQENRAASRLGNKWWGIVGALLIASAFFIKNMVLILPLLIGVGLVFPYLFKAFSILFQPVYKLLFGFTGELTMRNLMRNPVHTAMTSIILCFGVGEEWIDRFPLFVASGMTQSELVEQLQDDEIVLDKISFKVWGGKVGETITLQTIDGMKTFKVVAAVESMKNSGYGAFLPKQSFKDHFGVKYERNALVIKDADTSPLQLRERVFDEFGERIEEMWGPEDWVTVIGMQYISSFSIINGLIILSLVVSGIGITNTLLINIMERIRELGMMRAVGVTRSQVIRMILLEGLGFGLSAAFIGCMVGVTLIYITSSFVQINSLTFDFEVSWIIVVGCGLFGLMISLFSSFSPAFKASRTPLSEAIRYE